MRDIAIHVVYSTVIYSTYTFIPYSNMNHRMLSYPVLENFVIIYDESWTDCLFHMLDIGLDQNYDKRDGIQKSWAGRLINLPYIK